jgi:hypothetical protein
VPYGGPRESSREIVLASQARRSIIARRATRKEDPSAG